MHSAASANDKKRPYDWARVVREDLIKAAAIKCLFWGVLAAGLKVLWDAAFSTSDPMIACATKVGAIACATKVGAIACATKVGAIACATKVGGDRGANKIKQKYKLEI